MRSSPAGSARAGREDCDLVLSVIERCPYTTTLNLTYLLSHPTEPLEYPDMRIRIYHDARLVEAQAWAAAHPHPLLKALRSRAERELDQRWARNLMLNKWLEYCVERGHRFRRGREDCLALMSRLGGGDRFSHEGIATAWAFLKRRRAAR